MYYIPWKQTLKVPFTTAADDILFSFYHFPWKQSLNSHVNCRRFPGKSSFMFSGKKINKNVVCSDFEWPSMATWSSLRNGMPIRRHDVNANKISETKNTGKSKNRNLGFIETLRMTAWWFAWLHTSPSTSHERMWYGSGKTRLPTDPALL